MMKKLFFAFFWAFAAAAPLLGGWSRALDKPGSSGMAYSDEAIYLELINLALAPGINLLDRERVVLVLMKEWPDILKELRPKAAEGARLLDVLDDLRGPADLMRLIWQWDDERGAVLPRLPIEKESLLMEAALSRDPNRKRAAKAVFSRLQEVSIASILEILGDGRLSEAFLFDHAVAEYTYRGGVFQQFVAAALRSLEEPVSKKQGHFSAGSRIYQVSKNPGGEDGYRILELFAERRPRGGIDFGHEALNSLKEVFGSKFPWTNMHLEALTSLKAVSGGEGSDSPAGERKKILAAEFLALARPDKAVLDILEKAMADPSPGLRRAAEHSFKMLRAAKRELDLDYREARRRGNMKGSPVKLSPLITERLKSMQRQLIAGKCREAIRI